MRITLGTTRSGFNLVETLLATIILSGAVLTLGAISTNALTDTRRNRHNEVAASLAEKQLSLIDYMGIDEFIEMDQMEGVFEEPAPGYHWEANTQYQGIDNLYMVTMTITWVEGKKPYSLTVQTMLNGASLVTETETSEEAR